jgi:hypothetical protein
MTTGRTQAINISCLNAAGLKLKPKEENTLWTIYHSISEIESTFRCMKTNLDLRAIYNKTTMQQWQTFTWDYLNIG